MRPVAKAVGVAAVLLGFLTGCSSLDPNLGDTAVTTVPQSFVDEHETANGSPIGYGLSVPDGAVQLGPLVRRRSPRLIAAYSDALKAARRQKAQEQAASADPSASPTPATPTPTFVPGQDSFALLDEPPAPDITTALLRVDADPGAVFESVLRQLADVLPQNRVRPGRWSRYCTTKDGVYTGCTITQDGRTADNLGLQVVVSLDPGDVRRSLAPPGSELRPVMTVTAQLTDEPPGPGASAPPSPRAGGSPSADDTMTQVQATWPDLSAEAAGVTGSPLLNDSWRVRPDTTLLLSGYTPGFAVLVADRDADAGDIARSYVLDFSDGGAPNIDVVEDRNEISTTYIARTRQPGLSVSATMVQSGRGDYIALFYTDAATS